jgi:hypothetical protein
MADINHFQNTKNKAKAHGSHTIDCAEHNTLDQITGKLLQYHASISLIRFSGAKIATTKLILLWCLVAATLVHYLGTATFPFAFSAKVGIG